MVLVSSIESKLHGTGIIKYWELVMVLVSNTVT